MSSQESWKLSTIGSLGDSKLIHVFGSHFHRSVTSFPSKWTEAVPPKEYFYEMGSSLGCWPKSPQHIFSFSFILGWKTCRYRIVFIIMNYVTFIVTGWPLGDALVTIPVNTPHFFVCSPLVVLLFFSAISLLHSEAIHIYIYRLYPKDVCIDEAHLTCTLSIRPTASILCVCVRCTPL